jgi:CxxC motif-containing protein (DUF1111 family)
MKHSPNAHSHITACCLLLASAGLALAQTDPGPRSGGPPLSGQPLRGLQPNESQLFNQGRNTFTEVDGVSAGLGPRFNLDSCAGCHAQPAPGGTSPAINPEIAAALKNGALNHIPAFIQQNGPVLAVRFRQNANGTPDGSVHNLWVITGRSDAPAACSITQPDFSNANNLSFRIPSPTFGLGLIEAIPDSALRANLAANAAQKTALGIAGQFNLSGNDGTITRFGWKAQNKSLLMFSGEAYNVEIGVTNELFPNEREDNPACATNTTPEDQPGPNGAPSDIEAFSAFMRFLAPPGPPQPNPNTAASVANGKALFSSTGCALCHTPTLVSGNAASPALRNQTVNLYSDLAIHHMGQTLNDGITQGIAQGDEWRSAPLWGLGDRLFLLHDGRTRDLVQAIELHDSPGSEAHATILNYQALTASQKQDLLNFLRSL